MNNYVYAYMLYSCRNLTIAPPSLPASTVSDYAYYYMFYGDSALTTAPEIRGTNFKSNSCAYMFYGCTSLSTTPKSFTRVSSNTTIGTYCFSYMFYNCTSLTDISSVRTDCSSTSSTYSFQYMFAGCSSITTLPIISSSAVGNYCYRRMFYNCKALTTLPSLKATQMANYCYREMFYGCSRIKISSTLDTANHYIIPYRIPPSGTADSSHTSPTYAMFTSTGGTFTGTPSLNTTYYLHSDKLAAPVITTTGDGSGWTVSVTNPNGIPVTATINEEYNGSGWTVSIAAQATVQVDYGNWNVDGEIYAYFSACGFTNSDTTSSYVYWEEPTDGEQT